MKIGDVVRMNTPLTPERYGLGLIQKIVQADSLVWEGKLRAVYHVLWSDEAISCQYDNEIVLVRAVE